MNIQSLLKQKNAANRPRDIGQDIKKVFTFQFIVLLQCRSICLTFYADVFKEINMNRFKDHKILFIDYTYRLLYELKMYVN